MNWRGEVEHAPLMAVIEPSLARLAALPDSLQHSDVQHFQHTVMAHRAAALGRHLQAVYTLTLQDNYAPALALARTSLEHVAIDELVFLGDKYVQEVRGVTDDIWNEWEEAQRNAEPWTQSITRWERRKNRALLVREGVPVKSESGETQYLLSWYYRLLEQFDPFSPRPSETERLDDGLGDVEVRRQHAAANKAVYDSHLKWPSIKRSLEINALADAFALEQLETHFRFLSAFTHPTTDTRGLLYGRNEWSVPRYDHFSPELCLLYVAVFAAWELRNILAMSKRVPTVGVDGSAELQDLQARLEAASSHLWFVGQRPTGYARFQANNQASWKAHRASDWSGRTPRVTVPDEDILYYSNPLERLVNMHKSSHEMSTGFAYQSPWPTDDARFR